MDDPDATPLTPEHTQDEPDPVARPDHINGDTDVFGIDEFAESSSLKLLNNLAKVSPIPSVFGDRFPLPLL